jgi:hypothetical protein
VLAINGLGVTVYCPFKDDEERQKDGCFRKYGFKVIVLARSDLHGRFICATACHSASINDIIAWHHSKLFYFLEVQKGLPSKYFFIGDEAFTYT